LDVLKTIEEISVAYNIDSEIIRKYINKINNKEAKRNRTEINNNKTKKNKTEIKQILEHLEKIDNKLNRLYNKVFDIEIKLKNDNEQDKIILN
jgi:ribonuclease HI